MPHITGMHTWTHFQLPYRQMTLRLLIFTRQSDNQNDKTTHPVLKSITEATVAPGVMNLVVTL